MPFLTSPTDRLPNTIIQFDNIDNSACKNLKNEYDNQLKSYYKKYPFWDRKIAVEKRVLSE